MDPTAGCHTVFDFRSDGRGEAWQDARYDVARMASARKTFDRGILGGGSGRDMTNPTDRSYGYEGE